MKRALTFCGLALAVLLLAPLPGCTAYRAYEKCGWHGCAADAQITAEVQGLLKEHPALGPPNQLYVHTSDRVVFLSGQVATDMQRATAEAIAREASGVRQVIDSIALEYDGK